MAVWARAVYDFLTAIYANTFREGFYNLYLAAANIDFDSNIDYNCNYDRID